MRIFIFLTLMLVVSSNCLAQDWKVVQSQLGNGSVDKGVLRVIFPRNDIRPVIDGIRVDPKLVFESWFGFTLMDNNQMTVIGELAVLENEIPEVEQELNRQGLTISALHNHVINERPRVLFLHIYGTGDEDHLARAVLAVLKRTATPINEKSPKKAKSLFINWRPVQNILGEGQADGHIIEFDFSRKNPLAFQGQSIADTENLETVCEVKFQMLKRNQAATYGEVLLEPSEIDPVVKEFIEQRITITALNNHMVLESPRTFFLHWWATGRPEILAKKVDMILKHISLER